MMMTGRMWVSGIRILAWLLIVVMAFPPAIFAGPTADPTLGQMETAGEPPPIFSQEELDQMLAPVALYPDSLLVQMLMAATYPMEVANASRWVAANPNLRGEQLAQALERESWDPSVKSMVNFPAVLAMMDQRLDWTQRLGDAFLSQQGEVMATVQKLRAAAQAQGTLATTNEQQVIFRDRTIVIEPVSPEVVYVPAYNPATVYGPWWYPSYPPYPYHPVGAVIAGAAITFGLAVAVGAAWGYAWGGFDWRRRHTTVNVYQNVYINRHINRPLYATRVGSGGHGTWRHDPYHRQGVAYRDNNLARQYGQIPKGNPDMRRDYRGRTPAPYSGSGLPHTNQGFGSPSSGGRTGIQGPRDSSPPRSPGTYGGTTDRPRPGMATGGYGKNPGALDGMSRGGAEARIQSDRGRASREAAYAPRQSGYSHNMSRPYSGRGSSEGYSSHRPSGSSGHSYRPSGHGRPSGSGHRSSGSSSHRR